MGILKAQGFSTAFTRPVSRWLGALAFLAMLLALPGILQAKNARKLSFHALDGSATHLKDFDGRIVVLNFWATWCGPCRAELPRLEGVAQQYAQAPDAQNKVAFILLSVDEKNRIEQVRKFVTDQKLTLPVWTGGNVDQLEEYSGTNIVPATLILDEHGEVVRAINGEAQVQDVKEAVDWLLSGRKGDAPAARVKRY